MIAITGGGTGGHLAIAKTICEAYNKKGIKPIYIGGAYGQDKKWFENYEGFSKAYFLDIQGVVNQKGIKKFFSLLNIIKHAFFCRKIFKTHKVNKVFSVGGYAAAPASFWAILTRKPFFIHEQNAILGKLNKLLKPFAKEVFSSYDNATFKTSYPISNRFFDIQRSRDKIKTILFLGGSQGASFINSLAQDLAFDLKKRDISIIHQCGDKDFEELKSFYEKNDIKADVFAFDKNIHLKMQKADFAISRAGASSLWELVAANLPTFFIPFPHAAANHQYYNAKELADKNVAFLSNQQEVKKEEILKIIDSVDVKKISNELVNFINKNGVNQIIDKIIPNCKF